MATARRATVRRVPDHRGVADPHSCPRGHGHGPGDADATVSLAVSDASDGGGYPTKVGFECANPFVYALIGVPFARACV